MDSSLTFINTDMKLGRQANRQEFKVCTSVQHRTVQINHQPDATIFQFYYPDVYLQLNMFRAFPRPSSGAQ